MTRFVYAADLHDDPASIAAYEAWHRPDRIWPSVAHAIRESGITDLELFRTGERLVMIIEAPDGFSPEARAAKDAENLDVQAWEALMSTFQRPLRWAKPGEKWLAMQRIFSLAELSPAP